jgi:hypothetical protein
VTWIEARLLRMLSSRTQRPHPLANDDWRNRFLKAAAPIGAVTPKTTLEAIAGIARAPWVNAGALYALFDEAYPQPGDGGRRKAPLLPYLAFAPADFALMLSCAGGGLYAPGKFMFDANGNLWSGVNWMPVLSQVSRTTSAGVRSSSLRTGQHCRLR